MARTQQSFANRTAGPIYVSVEPWPECFELEPGESLALVWDAPELGDAAETHFISANELVIFPNGNIDDLKFLIDGVDAEARSWNFRHK